MSDFPELKPGLAGETAVTVTADLTAAALGSGSVQVYSTPALIALLEGAAIEALAGHLPDDMTTVGVRVDVRHLAATPVGQTVTARAILREVDGRRLVFDVSAWDPVEPVAEGMHERFIVDRARFESRTAAKATS